MSLLYSQALQREAMAWHMQPGEHHPVVHSVRNAGFHGYVDMSADRAADYNGHDEDHDGFDEHIYDKTSPEPTPEESAHHDKHGEFPSSFTERHDQAYYKALDDKQHESRPDHEDDELMDFVGNHGANGGFWDQHAHYGPVDIKNNPVYATQSHVSQTHLDKYHANPSASTHRDMGTGYHGDEAPLMVTHNGRLHTIEGHHRVAAALQRGDSHIDAFHYDADKHGGLPDEEGHMPDHEDYEHYWDWH